jgi:sugar phosphate isomerase/epimerase
LKISTSLNVFAAPTAQAVGLCKQAGFNRLDYNYTDFQADILKMSWEEEERMAQAIRAAAEDAGAVFAQMHGPIQGPNFAALYHGMDLDAFLALARRSIRTAAILGAPWVVFHPGNRTDDYAPLESNFEFNKTFFQKLIPELEKTGVGIALENMYDRRHPRTGLIVRHFAAVPEALCELTDRIDHPLVGICWDTGHGHLQGLPQGDSLRIIGRRLKATHIQDNDRMKDQHLFPYFGTIDWPDVMRALRDIGYEGDFTYETHNAVRPLPLAVGEEALRLGRKIAQHVAAGGEAGPAA